MSIPGVSASACRPQAAAHKFVEARFCIKIPMAAFAYKRPFDSQTSDRLLSTPSSHSQIRKRVVLHQNSYGRFRLGAAVQALEFRQAENDP